MGSMELYHWYKSHGICVQCGSRDAVPGQTKCKECRSISAKYSIEYYANKVAEMTDAERLSFYKEMSRRAVLSKRRREYMRNIAGICIYCGIREQSPGLKSCEFCRRKNNQRATAYYRSHYAKKEGNGCLNTKKGG